MTFNEVISILKQVKSMVMYLDEVVNYNNHQILLMRIEEAATPNHSNLALQIIKSKVICEACSDEGVQWHAPEGSY